MSVIDIDFKTWDEEDNEIVLSLTVFYTVERWLENYSYYGQQVEVPYFEVIIEKVKTCDNTELTSIELERLQEQIEEVVANEM